MNNIPNYPLPDPTWDYAELWADTWEIKRQIEETIKYMGEIEDASKESDTTLKAKFAHLKERIEGMEKKFYEPKHD